MRLPNSYTSVAALAAGVATLYLLAETAQLWLTLAYQCVN